MSLLYSSTDAATQLLWKLTNLYCNIGWLHVYWCFLLTWENVSLYQATKSDRIYVNAPGQQQKETENIQLVSFSYLNPGSNNGEENERKNKDESDKELNKEEEEEEEEEEESITPGDLMAFAWQISRGMVCIRMISKEASLH